MTTLRDRLFTLISNGVFDQRMFDDSQVEHLADYESMQQAWESSTDVQWRLQIVERLRLQQYGRRITDLCCRLIEKTPLGDGRQVADLLSYDVRCIAALAQGSQFASGKNKLESVIESGIRATDAYLKLKFDDACKDHEAVIEAVEAVCIMASASPSPLLISEKVMNAVEAVSGSSIQKLNNAYDAQKHIILTVFPVIPTPPY